MPAGTEAIGHRLAARAYGVLATALREALDEARRALDPHAAVLSAGTLGDLDVLRAEFARRRIRIALYGEVKAGKSTLLNAIAGRALSPVAFDPLTAVPVRVIHGPRTVWHIGERDFDAIADVDRVMRDGVDAAEIVVETDLDVLQLGGQVDLLDTPGVGSETRFDAVTAEALRGLDVVVLVIRYPALFTQFTRQLAAQLRDAITKLFVVWNLDAACADLSAADRARHASTLRAHMGTAHELFVVDARAGFNAAGDPAARARSGLTAFTDAVAGFAASDARDVVALREAVKRADRWLRDAEGSLARRRATLEAPLVQARQRIEKVDRAAAADTAAAQEQCADCETAVRGITARATQEAAERAAQLRRQLRAARRRWIRQADEMALAAAVDAAAAHYADDVEQHLHAVADAVRTEAATRDTSLTLGVRPRAALPLSPLSPADRLERATTGQWQLLRRAAWRKWYLPGLTLLEQETIDTELAAQSAWLDALVTSASAAAQRTLESRLARITHRAAAESQRIKDETNFIANQAEWDRLDRSAPIIAAQRAAVAAIGTEARALVDS